MLAAAKRRAGRWTLAILFRPLADEAILKVTTPETWGEAMEALLTDVKAGRPADGIVAAVGLIGAVLAKHFPRDSADMNEIPDKLIEL